MTMVSIRTKFTIFLFSTLTSTSTSQPIYRRFAFAGLTTGVVAAFSTFSIRTKPTLTEALREIPSPRLTTKSTTTTNLGNQYTRKMSSSTLLPSSSNSIDFGFLKAKSAYDLDQELMTQPGFSLEQLMELAGLSVAEAAYQIASPQTKKKTILILCGPGNNGGDGLVAARHLVHFGFQCIVVYPKPSRGTHFVNLVTQCENLGIQILDHIPELEENENEVVLMIDAIFGFSFKGEPREPLATLVREMILLQKQKLIPILSVDIPSGWHVEDGNVHEKNSDYYFEPELLISLTAPKECARFYNGIHFIGGRFLPDFLAEKYQIRVSI